MPTCHQNHAHISKVVPSFPRPRPLLCPRFHQAPTWIPSIQPPGAIRTFSKSPSRHPACPGPTTHCVFSYRYLTITQGMTKSAGAPVQTPTPAPHPTTAVSARGRAPGQARDPRGLVPAGIRGGVQVETSPGEGWRPPWGCPARQSQRGRSQLGAHPSQRAGSPESGHPQSRPPAPEGCAGRRPPPATTCSWRPRSTG